MEDIAKDLVQSPVTGAKCGLNCITHRPKSKLLKRLKETSPQGRMNANAVVFFFFSSNNIFENKRRKNLLVTTLNVSFYVYKHAEARDKVLCHLPIRFILSVGCLMSTWGSI